MADNISTVPAIVNVTHYAGDTLTIKVTVAAGVADGLQWDAQVRSNRTSDTSDAVFTVTQPTAPGGPGYLTLPAAETARLADGGTYKGFYDCQVSAAGADPVTTIVQGSLVLNADVTRLP